jgi:hypothetical protein
VFIMPGLAVHDARNAQSASFGPKPFGMLVVPCVESGPAQKQFLTRCRCAFVSRCPDADACESTDRSRLQNLLTFCRLNKGRVHFVVVLNLTRFARDKYDHFALRSHLQSLGISLPPPRRFATLRRGILRRHS